MQKLMPFFVLVSAALTPIAQAQHTAHSAMPGMHSHHPGKAMRSVPMGMSGMVALQALSGKAFNVAFLSQMIAHHQGAIDMAQQTLKVAKYAETKKEARMIITDQTTEIKQMTTWLQSWYGVKPSQAQMAKMKADMKDIMAMKIENDRMFFEMMIPHHQDAIKMSQMALKKSDKVEVKQLAEKIIKAQKAEIARYKSLLTSVH